GNAITELRTEHDGVGVGAGGYVAESQRTLGQPVVERAGEEIAGGVVNRDTFRVHVVVEEQRAGTRPGIALLAGRELELGVRRPGHVGHVEAEGLASVLAIERLVARARIVATGRKTERAADGVVDAEVGVEARADAVTFAIAIHVLHVEELIAI